MVKLIDHSDLMGREKKTLVGQPREETGRHGCITGPAHAVECGEGENYCVAYRILSRHGMPSMDRQVERNRYSERVPVPVDPRHALSQH